MTPKQLAEEGLRDRLLEAVLAHTGVQPGWPHYDAGRVVVLVLDAIEPAIKAEFKTHAEEFRRLAAEAATNSEQTAYDDVVQQSWYDGMKIGLTRAAQMLEEALNG